MFTLPGDRAGRGRGATTGGLAAGLILLTADPPTPADDTAWAVRTGTSPTMVVSFKVRIAGVTQTVATITI